MLALVEGVGVEGAAPRGGGGGVLVPAAEPAPAAAVGGQACPHGEGPCELGVSLDVRGHGGDASGEEEVRGLLDVAGGGLWLWGGRKMGRVGGEGGGEERK